MNPPESPSAGPRPARFWRLLPALVVSGAFLLAGALGLEAYSLRGRGPSAEQFAWAKSQSNELPELWSTPEFAFVDQHGRPSTNRDLAGRVWIADFIYTECTSACPLLSAKLALVRRQLTDPRLKFVSFSVDPEHDTPAVLLQYAGNWGPQDERWSLLRTDPKGLAALAEGMRVAVAATQDPSNPILHTSLFFLVDAASMVRGAYDSSDDTALERLVQDAQRLLGPAAPAAPVQAASGAELYAGLGCAGCHENPKVAPSLAGLSGQSVPLTGGESVAADDAYLTESLVSPGVKVRSGYLNLMPAYGERMRPDQLSLLVQYLHDWKPVEPARTTKTAAVERARATKPVAAAEPARAPKPLAAAEPARIVEDPVCHMQVRVTPDTPHVESDGAQHYFCSHACEEKFRTGLASRK